MNDEDLVSEARRAPEGDLRAFEQLVLRHEAKVRANCRFLTRSSADSEDLAQEVLVKAYFGLQGFEARSKFSTWLNRIKANHCLNYIKKQEGGSRVNVDDPRIENSPELRVQPEAERAVHATDQRERIREVLDGIPDIARLPLILRDLDHLSYQEIAETLGIGLSAVKMRIKRGREEFRKRFSEEVSGSSGATS